MRIAPTLAAALATALAAALAAPAIARGAPAPEPPSAHYLLAVLDRGRHWTPGESPAVDSLRAGHMRNIRRMFDSGALVAAGPFGDDTPRLGLFVFRGDARGGLDTLLAGDPAIASGRIAVELHDWIAPAGIGDEYRRRGPPAGGGRDSMVAFAAVLLRRGPAYTSNLARGVAHQLAGHLRHLAKLQASGRLVLVGGCEGTGDLRGLLLFTADTSEARRLIAGDPAVRSGRFAIEIHPWWTALGVVPGH